MKDEMQKIEVDNLINIDLMNLLIEHFESRNFDDITSDHYSKTRLWNEYSALLYQIKKNAAEIQLKLEKIIKKLYEEEKKDE